MKIGFPSRPGRRHSPATPKTVVLDFEALQLTRSVGADQMIHQLKELAPETRGSGVAFFVQGYEKSETGKWRVARYVIHDGEIQDRTEEIRGSKVVYDQRHPVGSAAARGGEVSMFEPATYGNFLQDGIAAFPGARQVIYVNHSHGDGCRGISGEALVDGELRGSQRERLAFGDCQRELLAARKTLGRPLDLVVFDACLMGQAEVVSGLAGVADKVLASPEVEAAPDSPQLAGSLAMISSYRRLLEGASAIGLAYEIIDRTVEQSYCLGRQSDENAVPTLGLYDPAGLSAFRERLGELGESLCLALDDPLRRSEVIQATAGAWRYPHRFDVQAFSIRSTDLRSFLRELGERRVLPEEQLRAVDEAMEEGCDEMFRGTLDGVDYGPVGPLSVMLPRIQGKPEALESSRAEGFLEKYRALPGAPERWARFVDRLTGVLLAGQEIAHLGKLPIEDE